MGAASFCNCGTGSTAKLAFKEVKARFDDESSDGYSGTIAEKSSFVMMGTAKDMTEALAMADVFIGSDHHKIRDKYGPAGCLAIEATPNKWLFFGFAAQ